MRTRYSALLLGSLLLSSLPAQAGGIAIVDFQQAINEVSEGERARAELKALEEQKQRQIADLEGQLRTKDEAFTTAVNTYQSQVSMNILTDEARAQREQELGIMQNELMQLQQTYQQTGMDAEMELQRLYTEKMEIIITKMRAVSETIAREKDIDLVFEVTESGLVYQSTSVVDITPDLIQRYDGS
ncbi:MAG: Skp family chaperone for outer membrane protein [Myxococcota bacterium]|jgi:Skp family chaperone for outer membrane proteins